MDNPLLVGGIAVAALLVGAVGAFVVVRSTKRSQSSSIADPTRYQDELRQAETRGQELIETARRDAEQITRDADLRARDEVFRRREEVNRELDILRNEIRELERRAEKREDAAEQKHKEIARKERHQEAIQKKLSERKELLEKKEKQV